MYMILPESLVDLLVISINIMVSYRYLLIK